MCKASIPVGWKINPPGAEHSPLCFFLTPCIVEGEHSHVEQRFCAECWDLCSCVGEWSSRTVPWHRDSLCRLIYSRDFLGGSIFLCESKNVKALPKMLLNSHNQPREARVKACSEGLVPVLELYIPTAISRQLNPVCMGRDFCSGPKWLQLFFSHQVLALFPTITHNSERQRLFWGQVLHLGCTELIYRETCCEIPTLVEGIAFHAAGFGCKGLFFLWCW